MYNNNAFHSGGEELSSGVFPSNLSPPPYTGMFYKENIMLDVMIHKQ